MGADEDNTAKKERLDTIRSGWDAYHADRHGGWGRGMPCVAFHHTLGGVVNAALAAGFGLVRMSEHCHCDAGPLSKLPSHVLLLWRKPA